MPAAAQASSVCRVCKARKKKCDKVLPSCGYCTNKGLQCNYQQAELISNERKPPTEQYLKPVFTYLPQLPLQDPLSSTELALCHQAQNLITATGQYLDEVSVCYFQGVHSFVPMISRSRFHDQLLSYGASPRADFAMLLLSMSLLTCSPAPADSPGIESFSYYLSVKSLLCQAQTLCRPSLDLIQAGVLLAVFEYACGEPEQALMTIGVYARMAYAAGLKRPTSLPDNIATDTPSHIEAEQHDTWWAISICERLFLCEATNTAQPLLSPISDSDHFKPDHITSSASADPLISGFRNAAVAACLLDRAIQIRSDGKQDEINSLDKELQLFLSEMMHQFPIGSQRNCGAIAIAIRALFVIHRRKLGSLVLDDETHNASRAALETISRIVIDISAVHESLPLAELDTLLPSCMYIVREAQRYLNKAGLSSLDARCHLQHSLDWFNCRWVAGRPR